MRRWVPVATGIVGLAVGILVANVLDGDESSGQQPDDRGRLVATVSPPTEAEACRTILAVAVNTPAERRSFWTVEVEAEDGRGRFGGKVEATMAEGGPTVFDIGIPNAYDTGGEVEGRHRVRVIDPDGKLVAEGETSIIPERGLVDPAESGCQPSSTAG